MFQVLRKKYYNMVEDMKGKIRVYCRVRPMSKSELTRVRFSEKGFPTCLLFYRIFSTCKVDRAYNLFIQIYISVTFDWRFL